MQLTLVLSTAIAVVSALDHGASLPKDNAQFSRRDIVIEGTGNNLESVNTDGKLILKKPGNYIGEVSAKEVVDGEGNPINPATLAKEIPKNIADILASSLGFTKDQKLVLDDLSGLGVSEPNPKLSDINGLVNTGLDDGFKSQLGLFEDIDSIPEPPLGNFAAKGNEKPFLNSEEKQAPRNGSKSGESLRKNSGDFSDLTRSLTKIPSLSKSTSSLVPEKSFGAVEKGSEPAAVSTSSVVNIASNGQTFTGAGVLNVNHRLAIVGGVVAAMLLLCV